MTIITSSTATAAQWLRDGGLVAFPTETVFGIGADARNTEAIARIFKAKGRPSDNPLIVHVADVDAWRLAASELPDIARRLLDAYAPGPLTVVLPKNDDICQLVTGGLGTVGVRIPSSSIAAELLRLAGVPVAAPSANISGRPSGTLWQSVLEDLDGKIDCLLRGEASTLGIESTVVDCTGDYPVLLRPGAVSFAEISRVCPDAKTLAEHQTLIGRTQSSPTASDQTRQLPNSPGLRHPHYRPVAKVHLVVQPEEVMQFAASVIENSMYLGLEPSPIYQQHLGHISFATVEAYAKEFYEALRAADRLGATSVIVQVAPSTGIGSALRDRQFRAAGLDDIRHL